MRNKLFTVAIGVCAVLMMTMTFSADANARDIYKFGGGPAGGTFQFMAGGISTYPPVKAVKEFRVLAGASGGSVENMRKVDSGSYAMGVVYSGHVYLGRNGRMKNDTKKYENVMGVAYFYGAPAQLVVKKGGGIKSVKALELFQADPNAFDLVITDQSMPQMTGDQLIKEMLSIRPNMPIIMCSGYGLNIDIAEVDKTRISAFIEKPVGKKVLAEAVRKALDG